MYSRKDRVSPLQRLSARISGKSGGTAEVFRPEAVLLQGFYISVLTTNTQTKGDQNYGKRTAEGL